MIQELILKNRSVRRFFEDEEVSIETLKQLVDLGRLSASGANLQPLKYMLSNKKGLNARIFECLVWAGYLKDWDGPTEGERPSAYVIILGDTEIRKDVGCDDGIVAQSILLGAVEKGLAGCMIGSIKRDKLRDVLNIDERFEIKLVLAIGKAKEKIVVEDIEVGDSIEYYRDGDGVHHVPKRKLDDIILRSA